MGLLSSIFGGGDKTTSTTNQTTNNLNDSRVGAEGNAIAVGAGGSFSVVDNSKDVSAELVVPLVGNVVQLANESGKRSADLAESVIAKAAGMGEKVSLASLDAISKGQADALKFASGVTGEGLDLARATATLNTTLARDVLDASAVQSKNVLAGAQAGLDFGLTALGDVRRASEGALEFGVTALDSVKSANARVLDLVEGIAKDSQKQTADARAGAERTITEVLSFKEAGDTKVAGDLIKYGAVAAAVIAAAILFRSKAA